MTNYDEWKPFQWHCVNCGTLVAGLKNEKGDIKVQCSKCHTVMVRTLKTPKHDKIDVYAPAGMVRI